MLENRIKENESMISGAERVRENLPVNRNGFQMIVGTLDEFKEIVRNFVNSFVTDKKLKHEMLKNLNTFEFRILNPNENMPKISGSVGYNKMSKKIDKYTVVGWKENGNKIRFSLNDVKTCVHELFHSVSSKHSVKRIQKYNKEENKIKKENESNEFHNGPKNKYGEQDERIGETEAMFAEMLFIDKLENEPEKFIPQRIMNSGFDPKEEALTLKHRKIDDFISNSRGSIDEQNKDREMDYRYVVSEVNALVLFDQYKQNPNETMKKLSAYLKEDYKFNIDKSLNYFSDGKIKNFGDATRQFNGNYGKAFKQEIKDEKGFDGNLHEVRDELTESLNNLEIDDDKKEHLINQYKTWEHSIESKFAEEPLKNIDNLINYIKQNEDLTKEQIDEIIKKMDRIKQNILDKTQTKQKQNTNNTLELEHGIEKEA